MAKYKIEQGNDQFYPASLSVERGHKIRFHLHGERRNFASIVPEKGLFTEDGEIKRNEERTVRDNASGTFKINAAKEPREGGPADGMEGTIKVGTGGHNHPDKGHGPG